MARELDWEINELHRMISESDKPLKVTIKVERGYNRVDLDLSELKQGTLTDEYLLAVIEERIVNLQKESDSLFEDTESEDSHE